MMDDVVNRLSHELADAMAVAVANDPGVDACYEKARAAGYRMKVSLEAVVGFAHRNGETASSHPQPPSGKTPEAMNPNDRRFLRSLRIAADEATHT